jgi:transposase-like protein
VALYHRSGKSITSLAAELGVAHESLRQWIKREALDRASATTA